MADTAPLCGALAARTAATKRQRAAEALTAMDKSGEPITFAGALARHRAEPRTELANAKERARRLAEEVALLRDRLGRQLGAGTDAARCHASLLDQLEQRGAELEADKPSTAPTRHPARRQVRELAETLDAARAMNRELLNEINRQTGDGGAGSRTHRHR